MRKDFGAKTWFYPMPVLIIGTYDENGVPNAMNAAWGGVYDYDQVILCLSEEHKTTKNIKRTGAFTLHFGTLPHLKQCDYVGLVSGNSMPNKLESAGFHTVKSAFVDAPIIEELPMALECKLLKETENGNLIGEIVNISADEHILGMDGLIDPAKLQAIAYDAVHNDYLLVSEKVGNAFQDGAEIEP